jgi:Zn-dependent peptidase ImmA (M78 family)
MHQSHFDNVEEHLDAVKQPIDGDSTVPLFRQDTLPLSAQERTMEIEANAVAAELLMPSEEFKKAWTVTHDIEGIAGRFRVSQSAAAIRTKTLFGETFM